MIRLRSFYSILACCLAVSTVSAQSFYDPYLLPMGQWVGRGRIFSCTHEPFRWLDGGQVREVAHPKLPNPFVGLTTVESPSNLGGLGFFAQDSLWINGWKDKCTLLYRHSAKGWEESVRITSLSRRRVASMIPLRNGRYLVFNPPDPEPKSGRENPYHHGIFAIDERGHLFAKSLDSLPDKDWFKDANLVRSSRLDAAAMTEDHFIVCCPEYGRFWLFSMEDGRLQRTVDLYGKEVSKLLGHKNLPRMVVELQPRKDGRILISAREETLIKPLIEEVAKADSRLRSLLDGPLHESQAADLQRTLDRTIAEALMPYPGIAWFELHPETGRIRRLNPSPVGAKDILPVGQDAPFWIVDEDDRVIYTDAEFRTLARTSKTKAQLGIKR